MDISVASNFERLVYDFFLERNAAECAAMFDTFPTSAIALESEIWSKKDKLFSSSKVNDHNTKTLIQDIFESHNYILDTHTAVAAEEALKQSSDDNHYVILSTAHPAKVPKVYEELGIDLTAIPEALVVMEGVSSWESFSRILILSESCCLSRDWMIWHLAMLVLNSLFWKGSGVFGFLL